jgi:hypothetical protein
MVIGTAMAMLIQLAAFVPVIGLLTILIFYGYFIAYYYQILQKTATGSDVEPDWPDVSDFLDDMVIPTLQVIGVLIISNLLRALANRRGFTALFSHSGIWNVLLSHGPSRRGHPWQSRWRQPHPRDS